MNGERLLQSQAEVHSIGYIYTHALRALNAFLSLVTLCFLVLNCETKLYICWDSVKSGAFVKYQIKTLLSVDCITQ